MTDPYLYQTQINDLIIKALRFANAANYNIMDLNMFDYCFHDSMNFLSAKENLRFIGGYTKKNIEEIKKPFCYEGKK